MGYEMRLNKATIGDWFMDASHLCIILSIPLIFYSVNFYSYSIIASAIFWFISISIEKFRIVTTSKNQIFLYLIFYLTLLVGLIYTENIKQGLLELETSFGIIAFPILLYTTRPLKPILIKTAL